VWSYKGWTGDFYPAKSRPQDFLSLYSDRFTAVEGNTTFYAVPNAATIARWQAKTPPQFKFCPKFPKTVTHGGLLAPQIAEALAFIERMSGLGDKLGPIFAQLPPTYGPQFLDDLTAFLQALPRSQREIALEVRHPNWFQDSHTRKLSTRLQQLGVGKVLLDTRPIYNCPDDPQIASERRKPNVPLQAIATADFSLIRFISHPKSEFNEPYLQEWAQQVDCWLRQGKTLYFFVHCPLEERSPHTARDFQQLLERQATPVPSLPWDRIALSPQQLTLF